MTPTALDFLGEYCDGVHRNEFQLDSGGDGTTIKPTLYYPGAANAPPVNDFTGTRPVSYQSFANNSLSYDMNRPAGTAYYHKPRGSWKLKKMYALNAGVQRVPTVADKEVYVQFEVCEPLLMSPFIFGSGFGKQGFYGIQTINFK